MDPAWADTTAQISSQYRIGADRGVAHMWSSKLRGPQIPICVALMLFRLCQTDQYMGVLRSNPSHWPGGLIRRMALSRQSEGPGVTICAIAEKLRTWNVSEMCFIIYRLQNIRDLPFAVPGSFRSQNAFELHSIIFRLHHIGAKYKGWFPIKHGPLIWAERWMVEIWLAVRYRREQGLPHKIAETRRTRNAIVPTFYQYRVRPIDSPISASFHWKGSIGPEMFLNATL